jgi:hypothetical protein
MHIVNNIDIGELLPVANLCPHLPSEDKVDGVYRNLETLSSIESGGPTTGGAGGALSTAHDVIIS